MGLVGFHGLHAEVQLLGDLPRAVAFADQAEDFQFAVGQGRERRASRLVRAPPMYCCSIRLAIRSLR